MSRLLKKLFFVMFLCLNLNSVTSNDDYIESSFGDNYDEVVSEDGGSNNAYLSAFEDDADEGWNDAESQSHGRGLYSDGVNIDYESTSNRRGVYSDGVKIDYESTSNRRGVNTDGVNIDDESPSKGRGVYSDGVNTRAPNSRQGRFLLSHISLGILDVMKMSPAPNYTPRRGEIFDFLRDSYPLPAGVYGPKKEYDFVIVGAGSSGCVLANRLSENGRWSVLLLEAGGPESLFTEIPMLAPFFQSTDYNWGYSMERQAGVCLGMEGQLCKWPRGRGIGGSSILNYMIYTRGNKIDWDRVAAAGNPGWSYEEVLPYFLKSERANRLGGLENTNKHNKDGLLAVEYPPYKSKAIDAFLRGSVELGEKIVDYNDGVSTGFNRVQSNTLNGWRHSAAKAFLNPFKYRTNLHILPYSRVTKIHINKSTKTATSVEFVRNRIRHKVRAKKEIIISAGALLSPQLLMLSGIGPKKDLDKLSIPVIQDLQVGQNMYDHISFLGLQFLVNCTNCASTETGVLQSGASFDWFKFGQGPLTLPGGVEGLGYIKTKISDEPGNYPDTELILLSGGFASDQSGAIHKGVGISEEFYQNVFGEIIERQTWSILPMIVHPKSKGFIKLKSKNPFHWPKFYYDYFSDQRDLATLVEAVKYIIRLSKTKAFQKYGSRLHSKHFPTCKEFKFGTDEYWGCAVRTLSATLHHQVGTCKMGPATDPEAVVDHKLRVHSIKRLRVADTGVIPKPLTAHTHAPAIMIGEKLADMLKTKWRRL